MGKTSRHFLTTLGKENPVFAQILGICSTLAVTNVLENTVVMCLGVIFVTALSNFTVSLLRKRIPARIRMMVETLIIASFVIIVEIILKAFVPDIWRQLGPYVGLIITNCIVMGRAEAFALSNPPGLSLIDGLGSGLGYAYVLVFIAFFRELLGSGTVWKIPVMQPLLAIIGLEWTNWSIMLMAPGAFFMLAGVVWFIKGILLKEESKS